MAISTDASAGYLHAVAAPTALREEGNSTMTRLIAALLLAFCAMTADNIIAGIVAVSYGTASHQGE